MISELTQQFPYWLPSALPAGYSFRPGTAADAEAVAKLINEVERPYTGHNMASAKDIAEEWETPGFVLQGDTCLAFTAGGELAAYYEMYDLAAPHVRLNGWGRTLPQYEAELGPVMLDWLEARCALSLPKAPAEARVSVRYGLLKGMQQTQAILAQHGYQHIRNFLRMVVEFDQPPAAPQWPNGLEIRSMRLGEDDERVIQAVRDSFRDHWGFVESPFEEEVKRWRHIWETFEVFRPENYYLAWDGDQIAGFSLCYHHLPEEQDLGWVGTLGVLRPWRNQGLGLALLRHSFCELYRQGQRKVGLGVDASSLTGALRLYENAGMRSDPRHEMVLYEKELRSGVDLTTQTIA